MISLTAPRTRLQTSLLVDNSHVPLEILRVLNPNNAPSPGGVGQRSGNLDPSWLSKRSKTLSVSRFSRVILAGSLLHNHKHLLAAVVVCDVVVWA